MSGADEAEMTGRLGNGDKRANLTGANEEAASIEVISRKSGPNSTQSKVFSGRCSPERERLR